MKRHWRKPWLSCIVLAALAAAPVREPDNLLREGTAAFERGDYAAAADFFVRAEDRATDPGLVAFNEGAALYQLGKYREAELLFRRCQADAAGTRRANLLYNLGNSVVQQVRNRQPRRLLEAIGFYEQCLQQVGIEKDCAANARHNLELARLLLRNARSARDNQHESNEEQTGSNPQADEQRNEARPGGDQEATVLPDGGKAGPARERRGDRGKAPLKSDQQPPPGKGNLPPLPDDDDLTALSAEDAVGHLKEAAARILLERREHRQRAVAPAAAHVLDW